MIIGDDSGAPVFKKLTKWWESAKKLDDTYMGPEFYWAFFQMGDFNQVEFSIVKWERWSSWRLQNPTDFNKGAFVGATSALFFYNPHSNDSFNQMKVNYNTFMEKHRISAVPILIIGLYDHTKYNRENTDSIPNLDDHKAFIDINGGRLLLLPDTVIETDARPTLESIYTEFLKILRPDLTETLDIDHNFWYLTLPELRAILLADRKGIKLSPRHPPPVVAGSSSGSISITNAPTLSQAVNNVSGSVASVATPAAVALPSENVAISPQGEAVPISKDITPEEIVELVKKGYKLPAWVVIPRHCPKCFNQKQQSIREVIDKSVVLMQNPMIYGNKFVCGVCGNNWR